MSRHLPDRPSLEYLKKEAKALLEDIQQRNPDAQLADALHQLARAYGFDSWPKLKAHVDATADSGPSRANRIMVDMSDRIQEMTSTFDADGEEHVQAGGYVVRGRWVDAHVLDVVVTKDGRLEGRVSYTISDDDRTLVVSTAEQAGVFDRASDWQLFTKPKPR